MCAYQGVRNITFSENFAWVLNEWPPRKININVLNELEVSNKYPKAIYKYTINQSTSMVFIINFWHIHRKSLEV